MKAKETATIKTRVVVVVVVMIMNVENRSFGWILIAVGIM
jgi:hypothetical protein